MKYYLLLSFLFCSCNFETAKVLYLGQSYSSTNAIEVFIDPSQVEKPYKIIGKGFRQPSSWGVYQTVEELQNDAVKKAKEIGAEAVIIYDKWIPQNGTNINTNSTSVHDSLTKITTSNQYTSVINSTGYKELVIEFIRYR